MSVRGTAKLVACAALFASLSACSLLLDELDLTCKNSVKDCAALNEKHGLDEGDCKIYQCRADGRGCEKRARDLDGDGVADEKTCAKELPGDLDCDDGEDAAVPGHEEICDGLDNNCNGWIDEGILSESTLEMPIVTPLRGVSGQADLKLSMRRGDAAWLAFTARIGNEVMTRLLNPSIPEQAALMDDDTMTCNGRCDMWEVAVASSEELLLAVGVSALGCTAGQLRVGVADGSRTKPLTWDGVCLDCESLTLKAPTSNLSLGVDRGGDRTCSMSGEQRGASAPSVGLLKDAHGQAQAALALWRAGPANSQPLPLVGLPLLFVRSNQGHIVSVQGAQSATSRAFDEARTWGSEPALIQPWRDSRQSGYLVAYDSAEGVELAFVPASASPGSSEVYGLSISAVGGARSVALAFTALEQETAPPGSEIALAWRSAAAPADGVLSARVRFDPAADPPLTLLSCGRLYEQHELLEGPTLLYHAPGFAEESAGRGGGFFLTWVERDGLSRRLMGARLDEAATATDTSCHKSVRRALNEEPFPLRGEGSIAHPFTVADADQPPRYGFITTGPEQRLNIGSLRCGR